LDSVSHLLHATYAGLTHSTIDDPPVESLRHGVQALEEGLCFPRMVRPLPLITRNDGLSEQVSCTNKEESGNDDRELHGGGW
jgi:hypothetical protein